MPPGARPDLSVDGTIEIEDLKDVLYVGRPVNGQTNQTVAVTVPAAMNTNQSVNIFITSLNTNVAVPVPTMKL